MSQKFYFYAVPKYKNKNNEFFPLLCFKKKH